MICEISFRRLSRVVNNTRFLVLPWVRVKHLASSVLAQVADESTRTGGKSMAMGLIGWRRSRIVSATWAVVIGPPGRALADFIREHRIRVLNVAGPRASKEPEVAAFVTVVLTAALRHDQESCDAAPSTIETDHLILRPLISSDAPDLARLAGRREIAETTISIPHPYSEDQARAWIATHTTESKG